ncbi:MAG: hypothetical protein ACRD9L_02780 [Bryobacteraceae bacterium]
MNPEPKPDRRDVVDALAQPAAEGSTKVLEQWRNATSEASTAPVMAENCNDPAELSRS